MTEGNGCGFFALAASDVAAAPADATRTTTSDAIRNMDGPPNYRDLSGEGTDYPAWRILTRRRPAAASRGAGCRRRSVRRTSRRAARSVRTPAAMGAPAPPRHPRPPVEVLGWLRARALLLSCHAKH